MVSYNLSSPGDTLKPNRVQIALTYWCNAKCVMCNIWKVRPRGELSFEEWRELAADPIFEGIERLSITGGEATLHPEFEKIVTMFVDSMPNLTALSITTNGFAPGFIARKVEAVAKHCTLRNVRLSVAVSVDGASTHESIRGVRGALEKSAETIDRLKELAEDHDISVGSGCVIMKQNLSEVESAEEWFQKNDINYFFQIVGFHSAFLDNLNTRSEADFGHDDREELTRFLGRQSARNGLLDFRSYYWRDLLDMYRDGRSRTTPCPFQRDQFAIDSFGDVFYCLSESAIGNVRNGRTISEVYFDEENKNLRKQMVDSSCRSCNSGCNVSDAIARDARHYLWFLVTGNPFRGVSGKRRINVDKESRDKLGVAGEESNDRGQ